MKINLQQRQYQGGDAPLPVVAQSNGHPPATNGYFDGSTVVGVPRCRTECRVERGKELGPRVAHLQGESLRNLSHRVTQPPATGGHTATVSPSLSMGRSRSDGAWNTPLTSTR